MNKDQLLHVLEKIELQNSDNLRISNMLKELSVNNENVLITLAISNPTLQFKNKIQALIEKSILDKFSQANIKIKFMVENKHESKAKSDIKNIIAIASGKGGVGKSTISSNLAVALQKKGYNIGLIDADIYGPSIPLMFDAENERPTSISINNQSLMNPVISYGVKIMSIGFFSNPNSAIIFRGPMATKALNEMISNTYWGELDYLLIDDLSRH